jgi:hypothetical protein
MKRVKHFIYKYWYSLLFCLASIWLRLTLIGVGHPILAIALVVIVVIKLSGMIMENARLRMIGIIGLNILWAVFVFVFATGYHPSIELTFEIPFFILLIGVGISIRGRFDE